jgi:arylsulfatase A-like enzyme
MPTMLSICGLKTPGTAAGRDLSGAITGGVAPKAESVYAGGSMARGKPEREAKGKKKDKNVSEEVEDESAPGGEWRALVTPTHKLITNVSGSVLVYDLEKDPYELKNLAEEPQHQPLKQDLQAQMKRWTTDTGDPYPKPSPSAQKHYTDEEAAKAHS